MSHRAGVRGETGAEIPDEHYGFVSSLRRSVLRQWMFVEVSAGIDWRRTTRADRRRANGVLQLLFEMHFGTRR